MADGSAIANVPAVRVCVPRVDDFAHIARRMRPDERLQFAAFAGLAEYDPEVAARAYVLTAGLAYCLVDRDGFPFAIGGFYELRPGVWETWGIGTPEGWDRHWFAITRECRRRMRALLANGAHRIQIIALASRTQAHAWYEDGLGMQFEGRLRGYCGNREDAFMYALSTTGDAP